MLVCRFPCVLFGDVLTIVQVRWHCVGLLVCRLVVCLLLCRSDTAHTADLWSWVQGFRGKLEAQKFNSITLFEILNGLCTLGIQKESTTYLHILVPQNGIVTCIHLGCVAISIVWMDIR